MSIKDSIDIEKHSKKELIQIGLFWIINIVLWFALYGNLCIRHQGNIGDYYLHNKFAELLVEGKLLLMYPGYHILVGIGALSLGISIDCMSAIVLTVSTCMAVYITYKLLEELVGKDTESKLSFLITAFLLNIIQPIFVPGIAPGYCSGNGYVSPTQIVCKPAALWSIFLFYKLYKGQKWELSGQIKLAFALILSCLLKPLFSMAFVPAMGLLLMTEQLAQCKGRKNIELIILYLKSVWPLILTGVFLILQYLYSFKIEQPPEILQLSIGENARIRLGFMYAWSKVVSNVWLSIFFAYFFPIIIVILVWYCKCFGRQNMKNCLESKYAKMCLAYGIISFFYISCLYQDNGYEAHMNFRNAWVITFCMVHYGAVAIMYKIKKVEKEARIRKEDNKKLRQSMWLAAGGLAIHVVFGLALYTKNLLL